jgi:pyruvate kinase
VHVKRTKIVCTVGPASRSPETLEGLVRAGMDVARLNFSHGTHDDHGEAIGHLREIASRLGRTVAVLQDLSGPKARTGPIEDGPVMLRPGDPFVLTARVVAGSVHEVSIGYPDLPGELRPGDRIALADGVPELLVESVEGDDVRTRVVSGGSIDSNKGIHLLGRSIGAPVLDEDDRRDLAFGLEQGVDLVALSYVRSASDVESARAFIAERGGSVPLIAKIETPEALESLDEIIEAVDGVMVARGDLGIGIPIEQVPRVQKQVIRRANRAVRPVITATEMLRSMVDRPRPTRAEATDVANAILDGTDAVMLSEETAVGRYPVEAVGTMGRIAAETESSFPWKDWTARLADCRIPGHAPAVARAACRMAEQIEAAAIITCTTSGSTTRLVTMHRPRRPVLALSPLQATRQELALSWGCIPLPMESVDAADEMVAAALRVAREAGHVKPGDDVIITAGLPLNTPGTTNVIKVARVEES